MVIVPVPYRERSKRLSRTAGPHSGVSRRFGLLPRLVRQIRRELELEGGVLPEE